MQSNKGHPLLLPSLPILILILTVPQQLSSNKHRFLLISWGTMSPFHSLSPNNVIDSLPPKTTNNFLMRELILPQTAIAGRKRKRMCVYILFECRGSRFHHLQSRRCLFWPIVFELLTLTNGRPHGKWPTYGYLHTLSSSWKPCRHVHLLHKIVFW